MKMTLQATPVNGKLKAFEIVVTNDPGKTVLVAFADSTEKFRLDKRDLISLVAAIRADSRKEDS